MGLRDDLERFHEMGEKRREDLKEFISYGGLGVSGSKDIKIPIKVADLPEFKYDRPDMDGVGRGKGGMPDVDQLLGQPEPDDSEGEDGDLDEEGAEREYYEMDPEQFAEVLDEELGLELEPKSKEVVEEVEGDFTDIIRSGPHSTLDFKRLLKEDLKYKLATNFDEEFVREAMKVEDITAREVFEWRRENNIPVLTAWIEGEWSRIPGDERGAQASFTEMEESVERTTATQCTRREGLREIPFCREGERYRYPKVIEKKQSNVVVVNIRDVSGSTRETKRELVERTFTPLDWYPTDKYDHAEPAYIVHDAKAWEVEHDEFSGIHSDGGTRVSPTYELAREILDECYPWRERNRYVFAAGDPENSPNDTKERIVLLMQEIDANLHAYVETQPGGAVANATHAEEVERSLGEQGNAVIAYVPEPDDVIDAIYTILSAEATAE